MLLKPYKNRGRGVSNLVCKSKVAKFDRYYSISFTRRLLSQKQISPLPGKVATKKLLVEFNDPRFCRQNHGKSGNTKRKGFPSLFWSRIKLELFAARFVASLHLTKIYKAQSEKLQYMGFYQRVCFSWRKNFVDLWIGFEVFVKKCQCKVWWSYIKRKFPNMQSLFVDATPVPLKVIIIREFVMFTSCNNHLYY